MIDTSIKLIGKSYSLDEIGNQVETENIIESPIIQVRDPGLDEVYQGRQAGYSPSIKFVISDLNYNNQNEVEYMNQRYTVVRTTHRNMDEIVLICEVKIYENR